MALVTLDVLPKPKDDPQLARDAALFIFKETYNELDPTDRDVDSVLSDMASRTTVVALDADRHILAIGGLAKTDRPDKGEIVEVATVLDRQREGLGRSVIGLLEAIAKGQRVNRLEVHSLRGAVKFYEKLGYSRISQRPHAKSQRVYRLRKQL